MSEEGSEVGARQRATSKKLNHTLHHTTFRRFWATTTPLCSCSCSQITSIKVGVHFYLADRSNTTCEIKATFDGSVCCSLKLRQSELHMTWRSSRKLLTFENHSSLLKLRPDLRDRGWSVYTKGLLTLMWDFRIHRYTWSRLGHVHIIFIFIYI